MSLKISPPYVVRGIADRGYTTYNYYAVHYDQKAQSAQVGGDVKGGATIRHQGHNSSHAHKKD